MKLILIFQIIVSCWKYNVYKSIRDKLKNDEKREIRKMNLTRNEKYYTDLEYGNNRHMKRFYTYRSYSASDILLASKHNNGSWGNNGYYNTSHYKDTAYTLDDLALVYKYDQLSSMSAYSHPQTASHLGNAYKGGLNKIQKEAMAGNRQGDGFYDPLLLQNQTFHNNYSTKDSEKRSLLTINDKNLRAMIKCSNPTGGYANSFCGNDVLLGEHYDLTSFKGPHKVNAHIESPSKVKEKNARSDHPGTKLSEMMQATMGMPNDHLSNFGVGNIMRASGLLDKNDKRQRFVTPKDEFHYT